MRSRALAALPLLFAVLLPSLAAQNRFIVDPYATLPQPGPAATTGLQVFDADGNGSSDLLFANFASGWPLSFLFLNEGNGHFRDGSTGLPIGLGLGPIIAGDLDGDSDVDLIADLYKPAGPSPWPGHTLHVFLNDGAGRFAPVGAILPPWQQFDYATGLDLGDVDGDGDLDLVCARLRRHQPGRTMLFLNQGGGGVRDASANLPQRTAWGRPVKFADLDGDGDLDILRSDRDRTQVFRNNGAGVFADATAAVMPPHAGQTPTVVETADLDADGRLDVLLGNPGAPRIRVLLNTATGSLVDRTATAMPPGRGFLLDLAVGDVDEDGDQDVVASLSASSNSLLPEQNAIYVNDGSGTFVEPAWLPLMSDFSPSIALADLDADGDRDLVLGGHNGSGDKILFNVTRHVSAPRSVRVGQPMVVGYWVRGSARVVFPVASPALAPQPLAIAGFGSLFLEPTVLVPLPWNTGGSRTLPVPNASWLVGATLHIQALVVDPQAPLLSRFTNYTATTFVR